LLPGQRG